jgi:hypothetical protein
VSVAAIQFAKHVGATVLATAGSDVKCEQALAIRADHAANNRTTDITSLALSVTDGERVDMVFDHVGPALFEASLMSLRRAVGSSRVATRRAISSPCLRSATCTTWVSRSRQRSVSLARVAQAWDAFCAAEFDVVIDGEWPLVEAAAAQQKMLESTSSEDPAEADVMIGPTRRTRRGRPARTAPVSCRVERDASLGELVRELHPEGAVPSPVRAGRPVATMAGLAEGAGCDEPSRLRACVDRRATSFGPISRATLKRAMRSSPRPRDTGALDQGPGGLERTLSEQFQVARTSVREAM